MKADIKPHEALSVIRKILLESEKELQKAEVQAEDSCNWVTGNVEEAVAEVHRAAELLQLLLTDSRQSW